MSHILKIVATPSTNPIPPGSSIACRVVREGSAENVGQLKGIWLTVRDGKQLSISEEKAITDPATGGETGHSNRQGDEYGIDLAPEVRGAVTLRYTGQAGTEFAGQVVEHEFVIDNEASVLTVAEALASIDSRLKRIEAELGIGIFH